MITIASISGGKDSIAMAIEMHKRGEKVDHYIYVDTGVHFPEQEVAIKHLEELLGITITRLRFPHSFWHYAVEIEHKKQTHGKRTHGYGIPSWRNRWCTSVKLVVIRRFIRETLKLKKGECVHLIGIAADEPKRLKPREDARYPLAEYGITEARALEICRENGIFMPGESFYDHASRLSCFCCPFTRVKEAVALYKHRPELWQYIKDLEKATGMAWRTDHGTEYYERLAEEDSNGRCNRDS